jgi:subtilase family serine protease
LPNQPPAQQFIQMYRILAPIISIMLGCAIALPAGAQGFSGSSAAPALITATVNNTQLVTLPGNTRPEAKAQNDKGPVPDSFALPHMLLQLKRSPAQERALETLIDQLHDPKSPNFHKWLTPTEMGTQYGLATADVQKIVTWLTGQGFTVNTVYPNGMLIDFSGTAGQVRTAFHTSIHNLLVGGAPHFANMTDPQIPAALAPAVVGTVSLHDFRPTPMLVPKATNYSFTPCGDDVASGPCYAVTPPDLATIYNFKPLFSDGISGQGQTIYLIEDSNLYTNNDWTTFRSTFGLSGYTSASLTTIHPTANGGHACSNPGVNEDDGEAILDAEYASAAAPSAAIVMTTCADSGPTYGTLFAVENVINGSYQPTIISMSYGICEALDGAASNAAYYQAYKQGVAQGVSIFVSSGDQDAAVCNRDATATDGIGVNGWASTPYNVAVGGTDFSDTYAGTNTTYWSATNTPTFRSALSYIPEIPWNDSCAGELLASYKGDSTTGSSSLCNSGSLPSFYLEDIGGSGGPSGCATGSPATSGVVGGTCAGYAKPSWQTGVVGIPSDGVRDLPDVSLFAANGIWNHFYLACYSDTANGGAPCTGAPSGWSGFGGTSISSPIMAGLQALVNQYTGEAQGNPNYTYYQIAAAEYGQSGSSACNSTLGNAVAGSCIFYDVTQGDNDAPCKGSNNCYLDGETYGVLSTSNSSFQPAYTTGTGWDFATGLGSVNAYNLVIGWNSTSFTLSVSTVGKGVVGSSPAGIDCGKTCSASFPAGSEVQVLAYPDSGWKFEEWRGACHSKKKDDCHVTMDAAESVIAKFEKK